MSKYICNTCNKPKLPDSSALKVGDTVNFTVSVVGIKKTAFRSKSGKITHIDGDDCRIETKQGSVYVQKLENITPDDAPSPLTYIFGECKCAVSEVA